MASALEFQNIVIDGDNVTVDLFVTSDASIKNVQLRVLFESDLVSGPVTVTSLLGNTWTLIPQEVEDQISLAGLNLNFASSDLSLQVASLEFPLIDPEQEFVISTSSDTKVGSDFLTPMTVTLVEGPNLAPTTEVVELAPVQEDTDPIIITREQLLSGAIDPEEDLLSISDVALVNAEAGTLTNNGDGTYSLQLAADFNGNVDIGYKVTDGNSDPVAASATLQVQAVDDYATDITLSTSAIDENSPGAIVGALGVVDVDGGEYQFTVSDERFEVVDGQLKLVDGVALDFEAEQGSVDVDVTAVDQLDNLNTVTDTLTITLTDQNDAPTGIELTSEGVDENVSGALVGVLSAVDQDAGDTHTFTVNDDRFEIVNGNELKLVDGQSLNFDQPNGDEVTVNVTVSDDEGVTLTQQVTFNVADVNDAPTVISSPQAIAFDENGDTAKQHDGVFAFEDEDSDALTYSVSDNRFEYVDGQLQLKEGHGLDFEVDGASIDVSVTADDGKGGTVTSTTTVVIENINEAPSNLSLSNNSIIGGRPGVEIGVLSAEDPELDSLTYSVSGADADKVEIIDGVLKLKDDVTVFSRGDDLAVTVTAADTDGLETSEDFVIAVTPAIEVTVTDDVLTADTSNANLSGMGGDDTLIGDSGDNVLIGGRHNDLLIGGAGVDVVAYTGNAHEYVISLLSGREVDLFNRFADLDGAAFDTSQAVLSVYDTVAGEDGSDRAQVETLQFSDVSYTVNGYELELSDQNDNFQGGFGSDWVRGGAGNDTILGGRGDDLLVGDQGWDNLAGESGNDVLVSLQGPNDIAGGSGDDTIVVANSDGAQVSVFGNSGADTFVLSNQTGELLDIDLAIADFEAGQDKLDLSSLRDATGSVLEYSDLDINESGNSVLINLTGLLTDSGETVSGQVEMFLGAPTAFSQTDVVFSGGSSVNDLLESINDNYLPVE